MPRCNFLCIYPTWLCMSPSICGLVSFISSEKLSAIIFRIFFCPILLLLSFLHLRYHMTDLHTEFSISITSFYIFPFVSLCFLLNIFFQNIFQFTKSLYQCLVCCLKILSFFFFWLHWLFVAACRFSLVISGAILHCRAQASHRGVFSCRGAQDPGVWASAVAADRLRGCGVWL